VIVSRVSESINRSPVLTFPLSRRLVVGDSKSSVGLDQLNAILLRAVAAIAATEAYPSIERFPIVSQ